MKRIVVAVILSASLSGCALIGGYSGLQMDCSNGYKPACDQLPPNNRIRLQMERHGYNPEDVYPSRPVQQQIIIKECPPYDFSGSKTENFMKGMARGLNGC